MSSLRSEETAHAPRKAQFGVYLVPGLRWLVEGGRIRKNELYELELVQNEEGFVRIRHANHAFSDNFVMMVVMNLLSGVRSVCGVIPVLVMNV